MRIEFHERGYSALSELRIIATLSQGRRASLCSALAPGFYIPRLWRCGEQDILHGYRCTSKLNLRFDILHMVIVLNLNSWSYLLFRIV